MASVTGEITVQHGGNTYPLRLTLRGLALLQGEFGNSLGGLLDGTSDGVPNFGILLRVVEVALGGVDNAAGLADEILTADMSVIERLMVAAFPDASGADAGNGKRAAKAKAA